MRYDTCKTKVEVRALSIVRGAGDQLLHLDLVARVIEIVRVLYLGAVRLKLVLLHHGAALAAAHAFALRESAARVRDAPSRRRPAPARPRPRARFRRRETGAAPGRPVASSKIAS